MSRKGWLKNRDSLNREERVNAIGQGICLIKRSQTIKCEAIAPSYPKAYLWKNLRPMLSRIPASPWAFGFASSCYS
ncbi:hypothetical protein HI914_00155 [Erysiphe necator]|nr:hypothetical protein HI914_00155 [Erysiphe necator]